jgi:hypothetical protein
MGALDDWTPVSQCQAVIGRAVRGRDLVEARIYEGAHHSFDALGLPVRYLPGVGNRSKPGGCCGATACSRLGEISPPSGRRGRRSSTDTFPWAVWVAIGSSPFRRAP